MNLLKKYSWEVTHIASITGVITILTLVTHLTGSPAVQAPLSGNATPGIAPGAPGATSLGRPSPQKAARPESSDPREIIVGPTGINSRYTLLSVGRKSVSPDLDELTVRLHVVSLAAESLVSPFESDMLELKSQAQKSINPKTSFHLPIPSGESRDQEIVFRIPSTLSLDHTTLQIHYYNYQKEIPLNLPAASVQKRG